MRFVELCVEGTLLKCLFHTAHNASRSKDVDALKFQLARHDTFYNGQNQQDGTECLLMLKSIIHKGSLPDSSSTTYPTGASLSDILFSFVLEKYIVCDVCGLRSPSFESSSFIFLYGIVSPLSVQGGVKSEVYLYRGSTTCDCI